MYEDSVKLAEAESGIKRAGLTDPQTVDRLRNGARRIMGNVAKSVESGLATLAAAEDQSAADIQNAIGTEEILPDFMEDAMLRAKAVGFVLNAKGEVQTKPDAKDTFPNASPAAWVQGELKVKAPRFWTLSRGSCAKGAGFAAHSGPDLSCFKGGTMTDQMSVVGRVGERAVLDSLKRAGITPPPWLKGGGR